MAPQTSSVILAQDLRAAAQDYKRDSEHKHKWEHGESRGPGRIEDAPVRPRKVSPKPKTYKGLSAKGTQRKAIVADRREVVTDSSCDEDVEEPTAAPEPDAEVAYSYDAARGPSHGSQVLNIALEQAVAKFENNVTEKLVHDEYELLNSDGESVLSKISKKVSSKVATSSTDEDDYEFI